MFNVRAARPEDAADIARVHVRSWQVAYRGLLPDEYLDALKPDQRAASYRFDSEWAAHPLRIVAFDGDELVGFANQGPCREDASIGELYAIYVDPDRWGQGVGKQLMTKARGALVGQGFNEAVLWALEGNERAHRFYNSDGWVDDGGRKTELVWGIEVSEVRFRRPLP
jgi:GNAT superfamily N-acetyltransferase